MHYIDLLGNEIGDAVTMESVVASRGAMMTIIPLAFIVMILLAGLIMMLLKEHKAKKNSGM